MMVWKVAYGVALLGGLAVTSGLAQSTDGNSAGFIQSNETASLDCHGGSANIVGSSNNITITGNCVALEMMGSANQVTIEMAANAKIDFVGSNNHIIWKTPDGKEPKISIVGSGNTVTKGT